MKYLGNLLDLRNLTDLSDDVRSEPDSGEVLEKEVAGDSAVVGGGQHHGGVDPLETEVAEELGLLEGHELLGHCLHLSVKHEYMENIRYRQGELFYWCSYRWIRRDSLTLF